jgi:hypothetical protein
LLNFLRFTFEKHKHINRSLRLIEESYERLLSGNDAKLKQVELSKGGGMGMGMGMTSS